MDPVPFTPPAAVGGYPPLEDLGLIGDGASAALVCRDGSIPWLCAPRFDAPPIFAGLLDARRGGVFRVAPVGTAEARQRYEPDTGILITDLRAATGCVRLVDFLALRAGADLLEDAGAARGELIRIATVTTGRASLRVQATPFRAAPPEPADGGLAWRFPDRPDLALTLHADVPLRGPDTVHELEEGGRLELRLRWGRSSRRRPRPAGALRDQTARAWREWARNIDYAGPAEDRVRRSALTLKLLDHFENGSIVAAPTSSLPEAIGGPRNWDYRYAWVRDAAFSVYALRRIGLIEESWGFLGWVLDAIARDGEPRVMYDLAGGRPPEERLDPLLEGYRGSSPVRWGNDAVRQTQHDVYGEILDCAWQWHDHGGELGARLWTGLRGLADAAAAVWRTPDHGIWEVRTSGRAFTYSVAMCGVALDRAARIAEARGLAGDTARWRREAGAIRAAVLDDAWDPSLRSLTEHLGGGGLDASLLALPLRRVLPVDHPRMVATTRAVADRLGAGGGLLYRYLPDESPDGLAGGEGAFLLCSFWLVDNLAGQGRITEAVDLFESLCARAGPLGLLPEQIDPGTGAFLGNHPQAFSHVGLISSAIGLARRTGAGGIEREPTGPSAP